MKGSIKDAAEQWREVAVIVKLLLNQLSNGWVWKFLTHTCPKKREVSKDQLIDRIES